MSGKKIQVHPLASQPRECYEHELKEGRFKNIRELCRTNLIQQKNENTVRFVCISDTHGKTNELVESLPDAHVLIHAGDFSMLSGESEIRKFNDFLQTVSVKFKHIVVIAGNHEISFDENTCNKGGLLMSAIRLYNLRSPFSHDLTPAESKSLLKNCYYLQDDSIELFGIKIFGSPWQPSHFNLAFNKSRGDALLEKWNKIPEDTDILVTHGPPLGIGDRVKQSMHVGCAELLLTVQDRVKPRYHVFGHIHEDFGAWTDQCTTFINASICDRKYNPVHNYVIFDYRL
ncbi:metallophosphoesterase domain-containing protein 1-like [Hydractinia symbiolongicarpus]|uniref:metallophosphoesterase domain-containing protein 1-like n=1 Tax=Hydractinia symbiolongicarpus TaxID=13093 RepID=UPI00254C87AE|nr:metallophosphoesterase domain-containing protein 1-like [Hydractinia symbiolongicarpus]